MQIKKINELTIIILKTNKSAQSYQNKTINKIKKFHEKNSYKNNNIYVCMSSLY